MILSINAKPTWWQDCWKGDVLRFYTSWDTFLWNKSRSELTNMITQQGKPTFFFTLIATDTKWKYLHALMPTQDPSTSNQHNQWNINKIISNPHIVSQDMHNRFKIFLEEVLYKGLSTIDFWCRFVISHTPYPSFHVHHFKIFLFNIPLFFSCRYEWKHNGSTHIHGFIWLEYAPNMDRLDWGDVVALEDAKHYFEKLCYSMEPLCHPRSNNWVPSVC